MTEPRKGNPHFRLCGVLVPHRLSGTLGKDQDVVLKDMFTGQVSRLFPNSGVERHRKGTLAQDLKQLEKLNLLILCELGYIPFDRDEQT